MVAKSTSTLTPAQRKRTTLPARKPAAQSGVSLIIASAAVQAKQAETLVDTLVGLNFSETVTQRATDTLVKEMSRYRRMFPASPAVQEIMGSDAPDLLGRSEAYRLAWSKVQTAAREALAARYVKEFGFPTDAAATLAKSKVETDRKNVSVQYRNALEAEVRASIENPVERAKFMLGHGFNYQSNVSPADSMCIPVKGAKLEKGTLVIPGHAVNEKTGTIKALKQAETPAGQDGKGGLDKGTETQQAIRNLTDVLAKKDQLGILESVNGLINGLVGLVAPIESTDLATRARLLVESERSLKRLFSHWGITPVAYKAARAYSGPANGPTGDEKVAEEVASK